MSAEILLDQSPYVEDMENAEEVKEVEYTSKSNVIEQFYPDDLSNQLGIMFNDRPKLLSAILRLYKFVFKDEKKQIWEKTSNDIQDDVVNAKYNLDLDKIVKESYAEIMNAQQFNRLIQKKTTIIPIFLDFCYVYYVKHFSLDAPFHKLPMTITKYRLITDSLKAYGDERYSKINNLFEQIIGSELFKEVRHEEPPFYLMTDMTIDEMKTMLIEDIKPLCKQLLEAILKLENTKNTVITYGKNETSITEIPILDTRSNNLDIE